MNKKDKVIILMILVLMGVGITLLLVEKNKEEYSVDESDFIKSESIIKNIESSPLDENEINGLIQMREEEKLAKDVYLTLYDKWNLKIFKNIAFSEQTHTDAIKDLLVRYELEDPYIEGHGKFVSSEIKDLYDSLIEEGSKSLLDALIIGAIIEDLDIKDLEMLLEETDNEDISLTYQNLIKGSRNHLRAFVNQIKLNNGEYIPKYITQEAFNSIISTNQERGMVI